MDDAVTALRLDHAGLLERAVAYTLVVLHDVTPAALSRPTPCAGWDLGMLLWHLDDSLAALHEAVDAGSVAPASPPPAPGDPVAACRAGAARLVGAWTAAARTGRAVTVGACPLQAGLVAGAGAVEIAVHGWDASRALGGRRPIPRALAAALLPVAATLAAGGREGLFAAPAEPPPGAPPGDRLVAFLGRDPGQALGA
ncbi:TIGR03086 family metal-binding protein [Actinomadura macrotermitis]|uniref:Mycothiol-dependent maleylpyruvate isomerase metal-binding domain-containing protein n=1 Tax=Actinomadura macrotermitis TaxID=2585200 RepID=A0A7K0C881_9ACTN|nr:TIGR03086 family metal-binding protein [Actinomadura macrotermitis]MQY09645.1 hypothetical protein [Actinomadura macrotermitis]